MQEAARPVPNEEKENLKELEEELAADLVKAKYIIPIELQDGPGNDLEKLKNRKYRLPILKNKQEEALQPSLRIPQNSRNSTGRINSRLWRFPLASLAKCWRKRRRDHAEPREGSIW